VVHSRLNIFLRDTEGGVVPQKRKEEDEALPSGGGKNSGIVGFFQSREGAGDFEIEN